MSGKKNDISLRAKLILLFDPNFGYEIVKVYCEIADDDDDVLFKLK